MVKAVSISEGGPGIELSSIVSCLTLSGWSISCLITSDLGGSATVANISSISSALNPGPNISLRPSASSLLTSEAVALA